MRQIIKYIITFLGVVVFLKSYLFAQLTVDELELGELDNEIIDDQKDLAFDRKPTSKSGPIFQPSKVSEGLEFIDSGDKIGNSERGYKKYFIPTQFFLGDYDLVWKVILKEIDKYELKYINKILGIIKTRWIDNTLEKRSLDSEKEILASRFSLFIKLLRPKRANKAGVEITIYKREQIITKRFPDWYPIESEGILEKTIFYRVNRLLDIERSLFSKEKKLEFTNYEKDVTESAIKKEEILKLDEEYSLDGFTDDSSGNDEISFDELFQD